MKIFFIIILFSLSTFLSVAQNIPNGSFEQVDTLGNLLNWKINKGVVKRQTAVAFYGVPFIATDSLYFISMENDTISSPNTNAEITNIFPLSTSPQSFSWDGFYTLSFPNLDFGLDILFTKWENNARDTIMFYSHPMIYANLMDSNNLSIQWAKTNLDLHSSYIDTITQPDTAIVTFRNDFNWTILKSHILILDNLKFSAWHVGVKEISVNEDFNIFPNPVKDVLNIETATIPDFRCQILDLSGREIFNGNTVNKKQSQIDLSGFKNGIYFLKLTNNEGLNISRKIVLLR